MARTITTYRDFWPFYLREHAKPATRALHYAGTLLTFYFLFLAIGAGGWWWVLIPVAG
ncbi:MAG: Mpo1-like protein [Sphingomonas sp.]